MRLAEAACRALTTLTFICPSIYIEEVMQQLRTDLHASALSFIGIEERGIWSTPADQVFVDGQLANTSFLQS
jgi:hypothetical protein